MRGRIKHGETLCYSVASLSETTPLSRAVIAKAVAGLEHVLRWVSKSGKGQLKLCSQKRVFLLLFLADGAVDGTAEVLLSLSPSG